MHLLSVQEVLAVGAESRSWKGQSYDSRNGKTSSREGLWPRGWQGFGVTAGSGGVAYVKAPPSAAGSTQVA